MTLVGHLVGEDKGVEWPTGVSNLILVLLLPLLVVHLDHIPLWLAGCNKHWVRIRILGIWRPGMGMQPLRQAFNSQQCWTIVPVLETFTME